MGVGLGKCFAEVGEIDFVGGALDEDDAAGARTVLLDVGDRQAEDGAGVQGELAEILADHRHHAGVVRARGNFAKDHLVAFDEELHAENAAAAEGSSDRFANALCFC